MTRILSAPLFCPLDVSTPGCRITEIKQMPSKNRPNDTHVIAETQRILPEFDNAVLEGNTLYGKQTD